MRQFDDLTIVSPAAQRRRRKLVLLVERTLSLLIIGVWAIGFIQYAYVAGFVH
jgi:hypothetical protein